jgi:predicted nucleic acid-binding protein
MTYLVDSSVLIRFFQKRLDAMDILTTLQNNGLLVISALSVAEVRTGWSDEQTRNLLPLLYKMARVEPVTVEIAELSGQLRHTYRAKGKQLSTADAIIAATRIQTNHILVTFDKDFYPIGEVSFYEPSR